MIDTSISLEEINRLSHQTLMEHLEIEYTEIGEQHLCARMPVDHRTWQPMKVLHGGASVALAESVGSLASALMVDREKYDIRGVEINANHVRSVHKGYVKARAEIVHAGRSTHIWDIRIKSEEEDKLISVCRLTNFIFPKPGR